MYVSDIETVSTRCISKFKEAGLPVGHILTDRMMSPPTVNIGSEDHVGRLQWLEPPRGALKPSGRLLRVSADPQV